MGYELCIIKIKEGRVYNKRGDSEMLMWHVDPCYYTM